MMKLLSNWFKRDPMSIEERWLSQSTDLVDLENRQKMIARGQAPWQNNGKVFWS